MIKDKTGFRFNWFQSPVLSGGEIHRAYWTIKYLGRQERKCCSSGWREVCQRLGTILGQEKLRSTERCHQEKDVCGHPVGSDRLSQNLGCSHGVPKERGRWGFFLFSSMASEYNETWLSMAFLSVCSLSPAQRIAPIADHSHGVPHTKLATFYPKWVSPAPETDGLSYPYVYR